MTGERACAIMLVSASLLEIMASSLLNGEYQVSYKKKAYSDERPLLRDLQQRCVESRGLTVVCVVGAS